MRNWKYILWTAGYLAILTACSSDDENPDSYDGVIRFDNQTEMKLGWYSTRGTKSDNGNLSEFGVFAYRANNGDSYNEESSVPNYMNNVHVTRTIPTGVWGYTPVMYWPIEGSISFFAYTPYDSGATLDDGLTAECTTGAPVVTYTVPDNVSEHRDLMLSTPVFDCAKTTNPVLLKFSHALSCITFEACTNEPLDIDESIKVLELNIGKFANKYSCSYKDATSITYIPAVDSQEKAYALSSATGTLQDIPLTTSPQSVVTQIGNIMVWPQQVDVADKLTVVAEYVTSRGTQIRTIEKVLNPAIISTLQSGKCYVLKLQFNTLEDITLTCQVIPWVEKTINIPDFD